MIHYRVHALCQHVDTDSVGFAPAAARHRRAFLPGVQKKFPLAGSRTDQSLFCSPIFIGVHLRASAAITLSILI
jgi:hypothetical protein